MPGLPARLAHAAGQRGSGILFCSSGIFEVLPTHYEQRKSRVANSSHLIPHLHPNEGSGHKGGIVPSAAAAAAAPWGQCAAQAAGLPRQRAGGRGALITHSSRYTLHSSPWQAAGALGDLEKHLPRGRAGGAETRPVREPAPRGAARRRAGWRGRRAHSHGVEARGLGVLCRRRVGGRDGVGHVREIRALRAQGRGKAAGWPACEQECAPAARRAARSGRGASAAARRHEAGPKIKNPLLTGRLVY